MLGLAPILEMAVTGACLPTIGIVILAAYLLKRTSGLRGIVGAFFKVPKSKPVKANCHRKPSVCLLSLPRAVMPDWVAIMTIWATLWGFGDGSLSVQGSISTHSTSERRSDQVFERASKAPILLVESSTGPSAAKLDRPAWNEFLSRSRSLT